MTQHARLKDSLQVSGMALCRSQGGQDDKYRKRAYFLQWTPLLLFQMTGHPENF
jgi:hypothetical protein